MGLYAYSVRDRSGKLFCGELEAETLKAAAFRLKAEGFYITSLVPVRSGRLPTLRFPWGWGNKRNARALAVFCREMAVLLQAGVAVTSALRLCARQASPGRLGNVLVGACRLVEDGEALSSALARFGGFFPRLVIKILETGEAGGFLDEAFSRLAAHFEREEDLRRKVSGALLYPALVLALAAVVVVLLLTLILPTFVGLFTELELALPWPTRLLLALGEGLRGLWWLWLALPAALGAAGAAYLQTPSGRRWWDGAKLRLPGVGALVQAAELARLGRTLSTLLRGGIPVLQGLQLAARASTNLRLGEALAWVAREVEQGNSLAEALRRQALFPSLLVEMAEVGENSGALETTLERAADFFERDLEYKLKNLTTLLEPLVVVAVGGVVAVIVTSLFFPLFELVRRLG